MNQDNVHIPNKKRINQRFVQLLLFLTAIFVSYHLICYLINPNYKLSYSSIFGCLLGLIWVTLTEKNISKLEFDDAKQEICIAQKSFFRKEKSEFVKYCDLNYEVKTFGKFLSKIFWKKEIVFMAGKFESIKLKSSIEFSLQQIQKIEKKLEEVRNPSS
jgi:hypothetical protein